MHVVPVAAMVIDIAPAQARSEVPAAPLTFGIPAPQSPDGPSPTPAPGPGAPRPTYHRHCMVVGGAGHGIPPRKFVGGSATKHFAG